MNRWPWRGWVAACLLVVLGMGIGTTATLWAGGRLLRRLLHAPTSSAGPADRAAARMASDITSELQLDEAEAGRVRTLLAESAGHLKEIRARAATEVVTELRASTSRIAAELPPQKLDRYYQIIARRYERLGLPPPTPPAAAEHK